MCVPVWMCPTFSCMQTYACTSSASTQVSPGPHSNLLTRDLSFTRSSFAQSPAHARLRPHHPHLHTHSHVHPVSPSTELEKLLQLDTLEGRTWKMQEAIATENVGLKEGLEWVATMLSPAQKKALVSGWVGRWVSR